jgi:Domain of unknown function (DUF4145)
MAAPQFLHGNVRANCPECGGALATFEHKLAGGELGHIFQSHRSAGVFYHLVRCAGCGRGGLAAVKVPPNTGYLDGFLDDFFPRTIDMLEVPDQVPPGVKSEFREAELCASVGAWRAGSSMLRSTLEKTLRANGYSQGSLAQRIDQAAADGAITAARSKRAHEDIRVLGNDILHDDWKEVSEEEFDHAHHYAQRILEDFYDDRASVEALLIEKGRIKSP